MKTSTLRKQLMKKVLPVFVVLAMVLTLAPQITWAAATDSDDVEKIESTIINSAEQTNEQTVELASSGAVPDNDQLLEDYMLQAAKEEIIDEEISEQTGTSQNKSASAKASKRLLVKSANGTKTKATTEFSAEEEKLYNALKAKIEYIAKGGNGEAINTEINIPLSDVLGKASFTASELGVESILNESQEITEEAKGALGRIYSNVNSRKVVSVLLREMPFEFYWFSRTYESDLYPKGKNIESDPDNQKLRFVENAAFNFKFYVATDYSVDERANTCEINPGLMERINTAKTNAAKLVNDEKNKSDYEKLVSYKNEICKNVEYDNDSASIPEPEKNDPWQLISVFDEDANTNVVCEGYSKAFKYLCDLTAGTNGFKSELIECRMVTGIMKVETGAGDHMWNVVTMDDGSNYMADVTNCDEGTIGAPDKLFLKGSGHSGKWKGSFDYGFDFGGDNDAFYTYDDETKALFDEEELLISDNDYNTNNVKTKAEKASDAAAKALQDTKKSALAALNASIVTGVSSDVMAKFNALVSKAKTAVNACKTIEEVKRVMDQFEKDFIALTNSDFIKINTSKVKGFKVKAKKKRKVAISWKKISGVTGYEIQYSLKKNFKKAKKKVVKGAKKKSLTIKKLKAKKKYFFRIRSYTVVKNTAGKNVKFYGKWSAAKKVKIKK